MNSYTIRFSTKTMKAQVHSMTCTANKGNAAKDVSWTVPAESAKAAARAVYEADDFEGRGLELPKICRCCK